MRHGDEQKGIPFCEYNDSKANIEAITGLSEGCIAYATDTNELGTYDGSAWQWVNLFYNTATVTGSNVTAQEGSYYDLTIAGMTANRDFNLPTPSSAGEKVGVRILDGDDTYKLLIKANSVELNRLFLEGESVKYISTGTGAGDWKRSNRVTVPIMLYNLNQAGLSAQSISTNTWTALDDYNVVTNDYNLYDTSNDLLTIPEAGIYLVSFGLAFQSGGWLSGREAYIRLTWDSGSGKTSYVMNSVPSAYTGRHFLAGTTILFTDEAIDDAEVEVYQGSSNTLTLYATGDNFVKVYRM